MLNTHDNHQVSSHTRGGLQILANSVVEFRVTGHRNIWESFHMTAWAIMNALTVRIEQIRGISEYGFKTHSRVFFSFSLLFEPNSICQGGSFLPWVQTAVKQFNGSSNFRPHLLFDRLTQNITSSTNILLGKRSLETAYLDQEDQSSSKFRLFSLQRLVLSSKLVMRRPVILPADWLDKDS